MKIDSNYINKHLAQQEAIKLRAIELNNLLSDVEVQEDCEQFFSCMAAPEILDIDINTEVITLSHEDMGYFDSWTIPVRLFDLNDSELIQYAKTQAENYHNTTKELEYMRLKQQAQSLGYKLIKETEDENSDISMCNY